MSVSISTVRDPSSPPVSAAVVPAATSATPLPRGEFSPGAEGGASPFARLLHGLGSEVQRGERLVRGAVASASGGELSPASLIALQAGVYRYSEVVDLAARLVDHATTAIKTVVQNQ